MAEDIVQIKVRITIPRSKWHSKLNRKHSGLEFNILSAFLIEEHLGSTFFEIKGFRIGEFLKSFKTTVNSSNFQILFESDSFAIINVRTSDPWILNALIKSEILLRYPLKIKNGEILIEALNKRSNIELFLSNLENNSIDYELISIGKYHEVVLLTKRQEEVMTTAYNTGYYEIPRKISLTDLAGKMKISSSALSELLRRIHRKLVKHYLD